VALEGAGKIVSVVTQNVDGLHRRAGTSADVLIELHVNAAAGSLTGERDTELHAGTVPPLRSKSALCST
jgi:NAD-dependent SIR2 family protein deacetylase